MHYAATQHLADADIDPRRDTGRFYSNRYAGHTVQRQSEVLVPISLGYVPSSTTAPGCSIPFEEDNLLDVTQRHLSMDWNTNVQGNSQPLPCGRHAGAHGRANNSGRTSGKHHGPQLSGSPTDVHGFAGLGYLFPQQTPVQQPYIIVRDVQTGCAYNAAWLEPPNNVLVYLPQHTTRTPNCVAALPRKLVVQSCPPGICRLRCFRLVRQCNTISIRPTPTLQRRPVMQRQPNAAVPLPFANGVAWARSTEYVTTPGPEDSYIGGAVSSSDLAGILSGNSCTQQQSGDGCVIRFRFQLPAMPNTPCQPLYSACKLTARSIRYSSLTFGYQTATRLTSS